MFRKLVSNLPFNPSLLGQVGSYANRLRKEKSVRRLGFGFMALAMIMQLFAVVSPPQKSMAYSSDYIINGLNNRNDILRAWDGQTADKYVAEIYSKFGLTRGDIAALPLYPNVTIASNQADYWTTGRTSLSAVSKAGQIKQQYKNSEYPINTGSTTIYVRQLKAWDIVNPVNYYKAFKGVKNGQTFYILQDCGNFTTVGRPPLSQPNPNMEFRKSIDGGPRSLQPGDQFTFRFEYRNNVPNSKPAENIVITDTLDTAHFDIVSSAPAVKLNGNVVTYNIGTVAYSENFKLAGTITVKLKKSLANGLSVCNAATLKGSNVGSVTSGGNNLCVSVINPCPLSSSIPSATSPECTTPVLACTLTQSAIVRISSGNEATLVTKVSTSNAILTKIVSYDYTFGDGASQKNNSTALTDTVKHVYKDGNFAAKVTVNYTVGTDTKTVKNVVCSASVETKPEQPLSLKKTAQNITQKLSESDTIKVKANAGDVIEYALTLHNSYSYDRTNFTVSDYIGDILDYANLDTSFLTQQGGSFDSGARTVNWKNQTVKAHADLVKKFRVTVKNPIPATNQPGTMTTAYDCVISNKYGNSEIAIPINCPTVKKAEYVASSLPNTGPGTSALIGGVVTVVIGYFFARTRLLSKELELIRKEYAAGGGY